MKEQYIIIVKVSKRKFYAWSDAETKDAFVFDSEREAIDAWQEEAVHGIYDFAVVELSKLNWL